MIKAAAEEEARRMTRKEEEEEEEPEALFLLPKGMDWSSGPRVVYVWCTCLWGQ